MRATVKWFNKEKGFGFLSPDGGGKDVFVHHSALKKAGIADLVENQKVEFEAQSAPKGLTAVNLRLV